MPLDETLIRSCSIWRALEVIGDQATMLIAEAIWFGDHRFEQLCARTGLPRAVVAGRLEKLAGHGLITKDAYCERPPRFQYHYSQKGLDTYGFALMMLRWELKHGDPNSSFTVTLRHQTCGHSFTPVGLCSACGGEIDPREVDWTEGPGLGWMKPDYSRRRQSAKAPAERRSRVFESAGRILGDRWKVLIIRALFSGINRFGAIRDDTLMATNILSDRLAQLVAEEILTQSGDEDASGHKPYRLTERGRDLYPAILALLNWGDRWYAAADGPPVILVHKTCGKPFHLVSACSHCHDELDPDSVTYTISS